MSHPLGGRGAALGVVVACVMALVQALLLLHVAWEKSDTADETRYVASSASLLAHAQPWDLCEAPALPKRGFGVALRIAGPQLADAPVGWQANADALFTGQPADTLRRIFFSARCATVAVVVLAGLFVWSTARRFGAEAALVAHAVWCFSPTVFANGSLATLDPWAAALMAVVLWTGVRFAESATLTRIAMVGVACGAATATKITTLLVVPVVLAVALHRWIVRATPRRSLARCIGGAALLALAAAATLWCIYGWTVGGVGLVEPCPFSIAGLDPRGGAWPFPAWIEGVVFQLRHGREGHANYLFGQISNEGWWWFYLACLALKITVGAQAMTLLGGVATVVAARRGRGARLWIDAALLAYPLLLLFAMSAGRHQANVAFLMPALPFVAVWIGRSLTAVRRVFGSLGRGAMYAGLALAMVEALSVHPHYLMFFNLWAGGPEGGPRYLIHREDWGQDKRLLAAWQQRNGIARLSYAPYGPNAAEWGIVGDPVPCEPRVGTYALHAVEVHRPRFALTPGCIDWLTVEPPDERLGYSIYLYRVDEARIRRLASERADPHAVPFWRSAPRVEEAVAVTR